MKILPRICCLLICVLTLCGQRALGQESKPAPAIIVFAEGAGGYTTLQDYLRTVYNGVPNPPILRPIPWSTADENLEDYRDPRRHALGAARMVREVQYLRQAAPASPIYLIGYSAGASVVLLAGQSLPPGSVERIILLGPAVSSRCDPRPALKASRLGIDSFHVPNDDFMQNIEDWYGAPLESPGSKLASTSGFHIADPRRSGLARDPALSKLRQYNASFLESGHFGTVKPFFLRQYVVPLIQPRVVPALSASPK